MWVLQACVDEVTECLFPCFRASVLLEQPHPFVAHCPVTRVCVQMSPGAAPSQTTGIQQHAHIKRSNSAEVRQQGCGTEEVPLLVLKVHQ